MAGDLVAVVIPAYNAEAWIDDTLLSVRNQTHRELEVVVVVDGATDGTLERARRHAAEDARIRVIAQANAGVCAARNAGAAATTAAYIAPLDADDLWHPEKTARQLQALKAGGPAMGFVYSPFRMIDAQNRVILNAPPGAYGGALFLRSLLANFVGNGSAILMRREAFDWVGGYDRTLRAQRLEGTEDNLLQSLIARRWRVGVTPEYLVGYRRVDNTLSSNVTRMLRSRQTTFRTILRRCPDVPRDVALAAEVMVDVRLGLIEFAEQGRLGGIRAVARAARRDPGAALAVALFAASSRILSIWRSRLRPGPPFYDVPPEEIRRPMLGRMLQRRLDALEAREEAFLASAPDALED